MYFFSGVTPGTEKRVRHRGSENTENGGTL